jgi:VanZ family protein
MLVIFLLSAVPGEVDNPQLKFLTELDPQWQNMLHIPLFGFLQWLWLRALSKPGSYELGLLIKCSIISIIYALLDELHQMFVPGRYASLEDILLDVVGVVLATVLFYYWSVRRHG